MSRRGRGARIEGELDRVPKIGNSDDRAALAKREFVEDNKIMIRRAGGRSRARSARARAASILRGVFRARVWAIVFFVLPFLVNAFLWVVFARMEALFGQELLARLGGDARAVEELTAYGLGVFSPVVSAYSMRWWIVLGVFAVFFAVSLLFLAVDARGEKRQSRRRDDDDKGCSNIEEDG